MKNELTVENIYEILKQDESFQLKKIIELPVPSNDFEYINLWFSYFSLIEDDTSITDIYLKDLNVEPKHFKFKYELISKIRNDAKLIFDEKIKNIAFKTRIDKYVEKYDLKDRQNIKKLILCFFYDRSESKTHYSISSSSLVELSKKYQIDLSFIFSITNNHLLITDKIFYTDDGILNKSKPFLEKEIYYKPAVYKIFADLNLTDSDIATIGDSPLLLDFNIVTPEYFEDYQASKLEEEEKEGLDEDFNTIEDLLKSEEDEGFESKKSLEIESIKSSLSETKESEIRSFEDDIDYLYEESRWIEFLFELRKKQNENTNSYSSNELSAFEIEQLMKKQMNFSRMRLQKSRLNGFDPRVEKISLKLKLNEFEKNVIKLLTIHKIFPQIFDKGSSYFDTSLKVGDLLQLFLEDPKKRVKEKRTFLKNSKLVKYNLIQVSRNNAFDETINSATISIDNRLLEYLGGEDFDFSDFVEGGYLYKSKIKFDSVILPESTKNKITENIDNFPLFLRAKKKLEFSDTIHYGNSLVMLFVGPSGTGKTMTANAISEYTKKKVLTINLNQGINVSHDRYMDTSSLLSMIFREARINDAVLFFDESEVLLMNRLPDILLEIEKHEGIVIFATNASFKVDEAMRRRINLIVDFEEPGPSYRKRIWEIHLPKQINLASDVDLEFIAKKYELNGGLIKNAVFSSLAHSVNRNKDAELLLNMEDLEHGAKEQLQNKLFMSRMEVRRIPMRGLDSLVLPENTVITVKEIINFEKAKKLLEGEWGFKEVFPEAGGMTVLFHGASGTGKTKTAEAIAFETGKTLKIVNYAQVVSMFVGGTEKALEGLLKESADADSIILFDEADSIFAKRVDIRSSNDRFVNLETDVLINLIERNNVFAILTTNHLESIDYAFFRRMRFIVEFTTPGLELRKLIWEKLLPPKLPLEGDISFDKLASKYEFNGGDIKNAIIRAATKGAIRYDDSTKITMNDFEEACNEILAVKYRDNKKRIGFN